MTQPRPKQLAVLAAMRAHNQAHGYWPSLRQLTAMVGLNAASVVQNHLRGLHRLGFVLPPEPDGCHTWRPADWAAERAQLRSLVTRCVFWGCCAHAPGPRPGGPGDVVHDWMEQAWALGLAPGWRLGETPPTAAALPRPKGDTK